MARILVVDAESSCRMFTALVLDVIGHQTTQAGSGREALDAPGSFDVLLTDLMMPQMMGDELAWRMRQRDPGIKVVYLTGHDEEWFKNKGRRLAGDIVLQKPVLPALLDHTVSHPLSAPFAAAT